MKKLIVSFCLFAATSIAYDAGAKTIAPLYEQKEDVVIKSCFKQSNIHYQTCMLGCVSSMSPDYIVEMCFKKCAKLINKSYLNCVLYKKYIEAEE